MSSKIPRREFIKKSALGAAGIALGSQPLFGIGTGEKKPNILLIMSDEHNPHIAGMYGNPIAHTPNMDALAAGGITFDTHYCNSPLCVPSRASFTSGKYISRVSTWNNDCELPSADIASLPRVLNAAGYQSYLCGKQHYDYSRRYGFQEIGGNFNTSYKRGHGHRVPPSRLSAPHTLSDRFNDFHPGNHSGIMKHDEKVTAGAVDFLSKRQAGDQPFFLFTGYIAPHFPLVIPDAIYEKYKGRVSLPVIPPGFFDSLPLNYKLLRASFHEIGVPDDVVRTGRELYHGLVEWIDGKIGEVVSTLRANKELAENTIIIYTSDHGENMGEHGMWWKSCMYEQASRVPLVVNFPKRWAGGQRRAGASSHLDLVQTLAGLGGGTTPTDWNGDSLLPWMDDPQYAWKDYAVSEFYADAVGSGYTMSRSGKWKYTYHTQIDATHPAERQLFDLSTDPMEFTNLADRPENAQRVADMHKRMMAEVGADFDQTEQRARRELAAGYVRTDPNPGPAKGRATEAG